MSQIKKTRSEIKREAIINAAKEAFQEFGVQATSMDKLAELAQVSKRTVYNHFATKEALVMHLISDLWQQTMVQTEVNYSPQRNLHEQLCDVLQSEVNLINCREYIELTRVAFGHFFYHPEALKREVEKFTTQDTVLHRWIKAAIKDNRIADIAPEFAADQLRHLIKGSMFWPQILQIEDVPSPAEAREVVEETAKMFLARYAQQ